MDWIPFVSSTDEISNDNRKEKLINHSRYLRDGGSHEILSRDTS